MDSAKSLLGRLTARVSRSGARREAGDEVEGADRSRFDP